MSFRVEARNDKSDKDYVNAIECGSQEEADEITQQWSSLYGYAGPAKGGSPDESSQSDDAGVKKSAANKRTSTTAKKGTASRSGKTTTAKKGAN